jgi:hypothetical protein
MTKDIRIAYQINGPTAILNFPDGAISQGQYEVALIAGLDQP